MSIPHPSGPEPRELRPQAPSGVPGLAKRPYQPGVRFSIVGFGGVLLMGNTPEQCARMTAQAFVRGVDYFDVAPFYGNGEAEEKMGPALKPYRDRVFLACKTMDRTAEGARAELERSLRRLETDRFDLYQFHSVKSVDEVERILAPGGAGETFLKARDEGKVRFLGFSAHSAEAAIALMGRFPLDSILFPVNYITWSQGGFGPQMLARARDLGIARLALKSLALGPWPPGTDRSATRYPKCWYQPLEEPERIREAVRFTLSEDVTAMIPPGDERLFWLALEQAERFVPLTDDERRSLMESSEGATPLFRAAH